MPVQNDTRRRYTGPTTRDAHGRRQPPTAARLPSTATIPPTPPRSERHRRHMFKLCHRELARLCRLSCRTVATATPAELLAYANAVQPYVGHHNRRGRARRAAAKIVRLVLADPRRPESGYWSEAPL